LDYSWSGPLNFAFNETVGALDVSTATIADATNLRAGTYTVIATNEFMCADTISINVSVDPTPEASALLGGGSYCAGESLTLTALNLTLGIDSLFYTITGPSNTYTGVVLGGLTAISVTIDPLTEAEEGTYTLVMTTENGCVSEPVSANVIVNATPVLAEVSGSGSYCEGDDVILVVENVAPGIGAMTCTVTGPNGFFSQNQVAAGAPLQINLTNISLQLEGNYNFTCTFNGCTSEVLSLNVDVELTPEINGISPNDDFCVGDNVNFDAENVVPGTGPLTYIWIGPNGDTLFVGMNAPELGPFPYTLQNVQASDAGLYTLILVTSAGCESVPQTVEIGVLPTPEICNVTGGGDACVGQTVTLSAFNCALGTGSILYVWQDPQGNQISTGTVNNNGPFEAVLTNIQLSNSGNYTLTLTAVGSGCTDVEVVNLNVLQGLNIIDITPDSSYCEGTDVTLTATTTVTSGQITYTWTGPNGFSVTETVSAPGPLTTVVTSISVSDVGIYVLNVTSDAGCEAGPFEVFVGLNPTFNITNVTGGGSYCLENVDDIVLTGTGSGTADSVICVWVGPNGEILSSGTVGTTDPFTVSPTDTISGTYTLICTTAEGCSDSASVEVDIIEMPMANILIDDTTLCELDTLLLCGQNLNPNIGVFDYIWTTPSGITITGQGNGTTPFCDELLPLATFGEGLYTLVISYQGCVSVDSVTVTLNPNPVISQIIGGGTYCQGDTVVLQFWNTNPAIDSVFHTCIIGNTSITGAIGGQDTVTILVTEPGFICCSLESFEGCVSSLACTEVIFEEAPDIEITTNAPVCANETLTLNGTNNATCTGDVTYTWTGPNGFIFTGTAPCSGPFPASVPNPVAGEYCLIVSNGNCADTACVDVEVLEIPFVEGGLVNGGGDYCEGSDATLSATIVNPSGGDIDYVWTQNGNPISTGTAPSGTTISLELLGLELSDGGQYCLELTCVTTGCQSDGDDCATVVVLQAVQNLEATGGGDYCEGVNVPLNGSSDPGPGNVTYTWTGPGFNFSSTAPNGGPYPATVTAISVNQSGVYVLVVESADGCIDSASVVVNVNPMPLITDVSGGGEYCEGETATLTFTIDPNGANSVDWTLTCPGADTSGTVTTITTISIDILVTAANAGTCTITATSDAGCEADPVSQTISITEVEDPILTATPAELCPGEKLTLTTTAQAGGSYEWFRDDISIGITNEPMFMLEPGVAGVYTVVVTVDGCGSGVSNPVAVTIIADPDAVDDAAATNAGEPVSGNVLGNDTPQTGVTVTVLSNPSNGTVTVDANGNFTYTPNEGFSGPTDQFTYEICLTDCPDACDEATVTITVTPVECNIPNVITPNGDNVNEVLIIDCAPFRPNNRLRIFNRWGDEIAIFEPYNNDWDGTYGDDKKDVPASTYFYLFEDDKTSGNEPKAGYIKVLR
jgi:gliding motility-associated-like protein